MAVRPFPEGDRQLPTPAPTSVLNDVVFPIMRHQSKLWNTPPARATYSDQFKKRSVAKVRSIAKIVLNVKSAGKDRMVSPIYVKSC